MIEDCKEFSLLSVVSWTVQSN